MRVTSGRVVAFLLALGASLAAGCREVPTDPPVEQLLQGMAQVQNRLEERVGRLEQELARQRAQLEALGSARPVDDPPVPSNPPSSAACRGLTWVLHQQLGDLVHVGGDKASNPYQGDQPCDAELPILCLRPGRLPAPSSLEINFNHGWAGGQVLATRPVAGRQLTSLERANELCASELGAGFQMAEFHDGGGGWNWWAPGELPTATRFWVRINDQPANPWNSGR